MAQVRNPDASFSEHGIAGGSQALVSASFSRPANTTAYTAADVVADSTPNLLSFAGMARWIGGSGYITKGRVVTNQSTNVARYRLHLYHTAPSAIADNSPLAILYANKDKLVGTLDFVAAKTEGSGSDCAYSLNADARLAFKCAAASTTLYGILETLDAFTPTSGQQFYVELTAEQN